MFLWIVVARGGEQGKALWKIGILVSSVFPLIMVQDGLSNLLLPQPEACISLSFCFLYSLYRGEMAVLLEVDNRRGYTSDLAMLM